MTTTLHIGIILGLLASFALPAASADGCTTALAATACTYDDTFQSGCSTFALTYIDVYTAATDVYFNGYHGDFCGTSLDGMAVGGSVGPLYAGVVWYEVNSGSSSSCDTFVYWLTPATGSQSQSVGCPAGGPPTPGWGEMLP